MKQWNNTLILKVLEKINIQNGEKWVIYGTGNGAEILCSALIELKSIGAIKYVIDRDDVVLEGSFFHEIPIVKLDSVSDGIDGILIAAMDNGDVIKKRIVGCLEETLLDRVKVVDVYAETSGLGKLEYVTFLEDSVIKKSDEFVPFDEKSFFRDEKDTKIITWYLPQFHQIEINNKFHGQGFTEWTNTTRAIPLFTGHYQPHIPYDVGYYDLMNIDTLKRQIKLAKHYGIYGFCMHYYWFSGKRIMEKPLEMFFENKELDMPFCLNWANESWNALWDGSNKEIILEQKLRDGDDDKFMDDILPYMKDPRYIKIEGKPVLVVYRMKMFEKEQIKKTLYSFRERAKVEGFPDLYIMTTNVCKFQEDVSEWGADALVEFPFHEVHNLMEPYRPIGYLNPNFKGIIKDATEFINQQKYFIKHMSKKYFRSALVSWDNTARKATTGAVVLTGLNPCTFKKWLSDIIKESQEVHLESENIVFVNSWNEWAEGSHLEPDMKYGYAYLQAVKEALEESR